MSVRGIVFGPPSDVDDEVPPTAVGATAAGVLTTAPSQGGRLHLPTLLEQTVPVNEFRQNEWMEQNSDPESLVLHVVFTVGERWEDPAARPGRQRGLLMRVAGVRVWNDETRSAVMQTVLDPSAGVAGRWVDAPAPDAWQPPMSAAALSAMGAPRARVLETFARAGILCRPEEPLGGTERFSCDEVPGASAIARQLGGCHVWFRGGRLVFFLLVVGAARSVEEAVRDGVDDGPFWAARFSAPVPTRSVSAQAPLELRTEPCRVRLLIGGHESPVQRWLVVVAPELAGREDSSTGVATTGATNGLETPGASDAAPRRRHRRHRHAR